MLSSACSVTFRDIHRAGQVPPPSQAVGAWLIARRRTSILVRGLELPDVEVLAGVGGWQILELLPIFAKPVSDGLVRHTSKRRELFPDDLRDVALAVAA